jgi:hypothetical protein
MEALWSINLGYQIPMKSILMSPILHELENSPRVAAEWNIVMFLENAERLNGQRLVKEKKSYVAPKKTEYF